MCGVTSSCAWRGTRGSGERSPVAAGFSRKAVAVANLWIAPRSLPAKAGSYGKEGVAIAAS